MARKIALASDHAGFEMKEFVKQHLEKQGYQPVDFGTHSTDRVATIDYARPACEALLRGECEFAILICGTGAAMSIIANKYHGISACCCSDTFTAELTRRHNNANVLCFGARVVGQGLAEKLVDAFLAAEFEGGVYAERNARIVQMEQELQAQYSLEA